MAAPVRIRLKLYFVRTTEITGPRKIPTACVMVPVKEKAVLEKPSSLVTAICHSIGALICYIHMICSIIPFKQDLTYVNAM